MKKIIFLAIMALGLFSCEKDPDMDQMDDNLVVYTDHANDVNFAGFDTYYMPDSILVTGGKESVYWKDANAQKVIQTVASEMQGRGYTRITNPEQMELADLGIQLSYVSKTNQVVTDTYWNNNWWNYNYWGPWWGNWYYPYPVSYTYKTNTLVIEMVNLTQKPAVTGTTTELPVIWYAKASGFQVSNADANVTYLVDGVKQAFQQSAYINANE